MAKFTVELDDGATRTWYLSNECVRVRLAAVLEVICGDVGEPRRRIIVEPMPEVMPQPEKVPATTPKPVQEPEPA